MRLAALAIVAIVALALLASQLLVPPAAERELADRLTERGGEAEVSVSAFPALRLLLDDGSRLEIRARGLELSLEERLDAFERLEGFDAIAIAIDDFAAGPFELDSFTLDRRGDQPYRLTSRGSASPAGIVDLAADRLGLPGGALLGGLAGGALGSAPVPLTLELELGVEDGEVTVRSGGGTVAGLPAGPLAELIAASVVARL